MSASVSHRRFVWIIVVLCILAIPAGLLGRPTATQEHSEKDSDSPISSISMQFEDRIQVVRLLGMITDKQESLFSASSSATSVIKQLRKAAKNKHIKGVLFRINSPVGTIATSQELHEAVEDLRKKGKPVVVSMGDVAASGGYYAACSSDKIVADPGTLTGSIGVIMDLVNVKGLTDKLGIQPEIIKSGPFKDIASPFRPLTKADTQILQRLIDDAYDQFVTAVATGRKMDIAKVKKIADGRVYSGRQALALGLVDQLGSFDDSLNTLQKICQEKYHLAKKLPVDESSGESFMSSLLETSTKFGNQDLRVTNFIPQSMDPKFYRQPLWLMQ
jgi:protease-4